MKIRKDINNIDIVRNYIINVGKEPFTVRKMVNYTGQKYETARSLVRHFLKEKMIKVVAMKGMRRYMCMIQNTTKNK